MKTSSFKDLIVWQKSRDLAVTVYRLTDDFPRSELYGLTNQMRRAVISISSNIAESYHRYQQREKRQFIVIAFASGAELESQIEVAKVIFPQHEYRTAVDLLGEVMRILNSFLKS